MAKRVFFVIVSVLFINFSLQQLNSDQQFLCGESKLLSKCSCDQQTDTFGYIPLFNIDCSRLDFEKCPQQNILPLFMGHLDLSHNKITTLDDSTQISSSTLYYLDFSYNRIRFIGEKYFQNLTELIHLNLGHNKLTKIETNCFYGLTKLKTLNLESNQMKTLPGEAYLIQLTDLEELILNQNNLGTFLEENNLSEFVPNSIVSLHLDHVNLKNTNKSIFSDLKQIEKLSIAYNPFSKLPNLPLFKLKYLDISGTNILNISTKNLFFPFLKTLKMNGLPHITKIYDYTFFNLHKLEELYIEHCIKLEEMDPISFGYLREKNSSNNYTSLRKFSVAYSGLNNLPDSFQYIFQGLEEIDLRGNSWDCTCKFMWITNLKKNVKDVDEIRCSSPESQANKTIFSMSEEEFSCFQRKKMMTSGAPTQSWLFPLVGALAIIVLILISILIYMGPYGQNTYKMEGKMVGPDSPYTPITLYPNHAEQFRL